MNFVSLRLPDFILNPDLLSSEPSYPNYPWREAQAGEAFPLVSHFCD